MEKNFHVSHYVTPITTLITLVTSIVYITWFAASLDKRVSINEQQQVDLQARVNTYRDDVNSLNQQQDNEISSFHTDVYSQLAHMDDKIQKIYSILLDAKKRELI